MFLIHFSDVSYTANEAYDIANHGEDFPCGGDGTFDNKEQMKAIYEVVSDDYWTPQWIEQASVY